MNTTINTTDTTLTINRWTVRLVRKGDKYGLNYCLTHDNGHDSLVEFYDREHMHTEFGQFASRYYISTLLKDKSNYALGLHGGIPEWTVSRSEMAIVKAWLSSVREG